MKTSEVWASWTIRSALADLPESPATAQSRATAEPRASPPAARLTSRGTSPALNVRSCSTARTSAWRVSTHMPIVRRTGDVRRSSR
ncbi:hypothetical protein [Frankia sp. QA3]|uniref:hypothetical protein n=1 Tax=Frankia sp. QA3 TaxID=710111 RepID=UPI00350EEDDF